MRVWGHALVGRSVGPTVGDGRFRDSWVGKGESPQTTHDTNAFGFTSHDRNQVPSLHQRRGRGRRVVGRGAHAGVDEPAGDVGAGDSVLLLLGFVWFVVIGGIDEGGAMDDYVSFLAPPHSPPPNPNHTIPTPNPTLKVRSRIMCSSGGSVLRIRWNSRRSSLRRSCCCCGSGGGVGAAVVVAAGGGGDSVGCVYFCVMGLSTQVDRPMFVSTYLPTHQDTTSTTNVHTSVSSSSSSSSSYKKPHRTHTLSPPPTYKPNYRVNSSPHTYLFFFLLFLFFVQEIAKLGAGQTEGQNLAEVLGEGPVWKCLIIYVCNVFCIGCVCPGWWVGGWGWICVHTSHAHKNPPQNQPTH